MNFVTHMTSKIVIRISKTNTFLLFHTPHIQIISCSTSYPKLTHSGIDAGGPLFQYNNDEPDSMGAPVLVGIISTDTTLSFPSSISPFSHIRMSTLLSDNTVDFLPEDFTDGLTIVTESTTPPIQTEFSLEMGDVPMLDYEGTRCEPYYDVLRLERQELRGWRILVIVLACTTGVLILVLAALGYRGAVKFWKGRVGRRAAE